MTFPIYRSLLTLLPALAMVPAAARGFDCLIEPRQMIELRSPVEGLIDTVQVERGATVRKGQVLVTLVSGVEKASLDLARHRAEMVGRVASARNRVEFAKRKYERVQQLTGDNFVSPQARDEVQTELRLAESELVDALENQQQAQLDLRRASEIVEQRQLRSPIDGYVVDRMLNPGDLAESGTGRKPVLKLAQLDPLRVEVLLPASAFGKLAQGAPARVQVEGQGEARAAKAVVVDRLIDAASGMFGVRLELPNPGLKLPAGARCSVEFQGLAPDAPGPATAAVRKSP